MEVSRVDFKKSKSVDFKQKDFEQIILYNNCPRHQNSLK